MFDVLQGQHRPKISTRYAPTRLNSVEMHQRVASYLHANEWQKDVQNTKTADDALCAAARVVSRANIPNGCEDALRLIIFGGSLTYGVGKCCCRPNML